MQAGSGRIELILNRIELVFSREMFRTSVRFSSPVGGDGTCYSKLSSMDSDLCIVIGMIG